MSKQNKNTNGPSKVRPGFTAVPSRRTGTNAWGCPDRSSREPFKAAGSKWNGAQAPICTICGRKPTRKCKRFGADGADGGCWEPWTSPSPPQQPSRRVPGAPPSKREAELQKKLDAAEKEKAESKNKLAAAERENKKLAKAAEELIKMHSR